ncbi:hypothetical protein [Erwinia sorbitola]|uniref:Uncharacterized protein n=1 Tax=Erwinia sorbitola TaxID=2681984 RepID=A0ABW9R813_9GAMM|nr:hypothetical protein [Erwinia sorbitola]MTD26136.1 hypothetical protein [Erwinia sorbitola]
MMNNIRVDVALFCQISKYSLLTLLLSGIPFICAAWHPIDIKDERVLLEPPVVYVKGDTLYYDGKIDDNADATVNKLLIAHQIKTLSINSIGGSIAPAMNIGLAIHQRKINIEIRSVCASACANYIFPAGIKKKINPDSYLLWHGSAHSPKAEFTIDYTNEKITRQQFFSAPEFLALKKMESDFYRTIGVEYKIGFCPQLLRNYHQRFPEKWFSYSKEDLEAFGVNNIFHSEGQEKWLQSMKKNGVIFANHCR